MVIVAAGGDDVMLGVAALEIDLVCLFTQ